MRSGRLIAAIGSSRSGKSQYVTREISGEKRVLIWDVKGEYKAQYRATTRAELASLLKKYVGKPAVIAFVPVRLSDFSFFCKAAQIWVRSHFAVKQQSVLIFEETADVTSSGKAPEEYGIILRRYLSYGVDIYAITQRPAESDKTAIGNASVVHICRLQMDRDRKAASNDSGVPIDEIRKLRADQDKSQFDYISVDTGRGYYRSGVLTFSRNKAKFTQKGQEKPL